MAEVLTATRAISPYRESLIAKVTELRARGLTVREIAPIMGISRSYVGDLIDDPDRSKALARRAGYGRACVDCGARTCGSEGRERAPIRCLACSLIFQVANKVWTREAVIEAIQEFATRNGRPPNSEEWIRTTTSVDGYAYPCRGSVYRSKGGSNSPFAKWADAVEAAGFRRPLVGEYDRKRGGTMGDVGRTYLIFRVNDDESVELLGEHEARSTIEAVEGFVQIEGRYATIAKGMLSQVELASRLVGSRVPL